MQVAAASHMLILRSTCKPTWHIANVPTHSPLLLHHLSEAKKPKKEDGEGDAKAADISPKPASEAGTEKKEAAEKPAVEKVLTNEPLCRAFRYVDRTGAGYIKYAPFACPCADLGFGVAPGVRPLAWLLLLLPVPQACCRLVVAALPLLLFHLPPLPSATNANLQGPRASAICCTGWALIGPSTTPCPFAVAHLPPLPIPVPPIVLQDRGPAPPVGWARPGPQPHRGQAALLQRGGACGCVAVSALIGGTRGGCC